MIFFAPLTHISGIIEFLLKMEVVKSWIFLTAELGNQVVNSITYVDWCYESNL